ncbi:MAG: PA14 domain-containing protein [Cyanobacteria bacterium]|nr:PA14 domain-containing protein [Cyanobacteriota bacterium]
MGVTTGNAKPYWGNGHYYAFTQEGVTWSEAYDSSAASTLDQLGSRGYLATVTSSGENDFITNYSNGTYTYGKSGSSPYYGATRIPGYGFLAGTDDNGQGTSEGNWIWKGGPESGTVFRSNGGNIGYTHWTSGQPNNDGNQDFLRIDTAGYWDDADPNDSVSGYITEWGKSGSQFTAGFASLSSSKPPKNGYESGPAAAPQLPTMTINLDRFVPKDYVDIRNGTPLIDIPIAFGGTAIIGKDYDLEEIEGDSYYSNGKVYVKNTSSVTLTFKPRNNDSWQAPRTITASLTGDGTENIYGLNGSSSKVWLFDDEPQLSLGQGAYKFIRTSYTSGATYSLPSDNSGFNTNADVLVFDSDGINESESSLSAQGLNDNFAIRWETYIRIPETGLYVFRTTTDDGAKLTLRSNNGSGNPLGSFTYWSINGTGTPTSHSTGSIELKKGAVVWLQFDYFENTSKASAKLTWDRPDGTGGTLSDEVIPASAMFLSEELAQGVNRKESSSDTSSLGFQLFANKSTDSEISVQLTSTSETLNSTVNSLLAQRRVDGSLVGNDYAISDASTGSEQSSTNIGLNGTYGSLKWMPNQAFGTLKNSKLFNVDVFRDDYAENTESVTLSLGSGSGYGVANASQTITIDDDSYVLSLSPGQNPTEGGDSESDLGWFTIRSNKPVPGEKGLKVRYQISGGSAERGSDYFAAQATLNTAAFKAEDLVVLPNNASETRIYISAIADAIREGNETISLKLIPNVETDDKGFQYQRYNIDNAYSQAVLTIIDSTAYQPAVVLTPADRTGLATVRAQLVNGQQQADFDVHLTSQPLAPVTVNLSSSSGTLSSPQLSFSSSNWTQPQRVTLTGLSTDQATTVIATTSSADSQYTGLSSSQRLVPSGWTSELELTLWEGGSLVPSQTLASVQAIDGTEGSNSRLGFELTLASPVVGSPVELFYQLSGSEGFSLDGSTADAEHRPQASYRPLELRNSNSSGGYAYADLGGLATVSSSGEISAEAWVRRDAVTTAAGLLEFTDSNGQNQIKLGFHETTGRPELEIRDGGGALLLSLIADSEVALQEWNHLAYSVEASGVARLYLNGELAKQGTLTQVSGLKVGLYEGRNFETLRSTTAEATINFSDSFDTAKGGDGDTFSLRASGQIQAKSNGNNSFAVFADDGVKIWVNGTKVVDTWDGPGGTWTSFTAANLVAGEWYDIQIDYNENSGVASLQLADQPNGAPITALRHVPLYTATRGFNSIGRTAPGSSGTGYLTGAVRAVGIWNTARSQNQIQASMLAASPGGSGLISGLSLNNSTANSVNGAPAAVLYSGSSNSATFASTPFYGLQLPVGTSSVSLPIVPLDDLRAEGTEALTLALIAAGRYSTGGSRGTATASFSDNEVAEILFLADGQASSTTSDTSWTSSTQFVVSEQDPATNSSSALGVRLNTQPSATVTLTLDAGCFSSTELTVTNPANPAAATVSLIFTPENWDQVQELRLQGVDDSQDDGDTAQSLSFTVSSSDALYADLKPVVSVLTVDDDATTADPALAIKQSSSAPLAKLSGPSQSTINEAGSDSATFTISLAQPASEGTLVFLEVDQRLSQVSSSDIRIIAGSGTQSLAGLSRFDASPGAAETTRLDSDGINESATSFSSNQQSGDFSSTWSGYLYIPETGNYNFSIPVQGGVRLTLDGQVVIDKLFDSQATWSTGTLQLSRGDFLPVTLDYRSFDTSAPSVALCWQRPSNGGTTSIDEVLPSQYLNRTDGFSLLIAKGSSGGTFTVQGVQDQVDENNENLAAGLLLARGVEIVVRGQSNTEVGSNQLQVTLSTSDRESITLEAGTVLTLGEDPKSNETQTEAIATFTLSDAVTIHRDRTATLSGTLALTSYGQSSPYNSSVVGLVAGQAGELYQLPDPSVSLTLTAPLILNGTEGYLATLQLGDTNLGSVTIPAGTALSYVVESTGAFITLVLSNNLTLQSGQTATGIAVTVASKSSSLDPTADALQGLSSAYALPNTSVVQLLDDDKAGLLFSLDASGNQPIDGSRFSLSEQGDSATRYVRLSSQPTESVTVYLETADASEALLQVPANNPAKATSRIALLFDPTNWQTPQAFTVLPADDQLVDGSIKVDIVSRTTSADAFYAISTAATLPFMVSDDDTANVMVELQQSSIGKAGNGFINLSLTAQPTADVTVNLLPSDGQFTLNDRSIGRGESLVFTAENWSTVQSVSLWAVDDNTEEDVTSSQLQLSTVSSDVHFNGLKIDPVRVDIVDNDPPRAQITLVSDSTEESKPGRFRIQLTNPAPDSAGSNGIEVNYQITAVSLDPGLGYPATPSSISNLTQSPGSTTGLVRIAPGQSSSDVIVVPIDDFVADTESKSFTVQLVAGDGYTLSNDSASNSATVQIINNDVAGVVLFTSGERIQVNEPSNGSAGNATFQLALLTQPKNDVTITLSEQILAGGRRQLGTSDDAYSKTVIFTPSNWYTAQQISVQTYDDGLIEDGSGDKQFTGIHGTELKYNFSSDDKAYDSADKNAEHFTNLLQAVDVLDVQLPTQTADALQSSLTSLQEGIDSLSLPIVGSLDGKAGDGLRKFITNLVNSVRQVGTPTPSKLSKLLSSEIAKALGIPEDTVTVGLSMQGTNAIVVSLEFADSYDIFSVPLAADFGLPGLGFQSEGSLDASFSYGAGLELVFPRSGEIYLQTASDKTYLNAEFNTSLSPDFNLTGGLGFLQLDAVNQPSINENVVIKDKPASTELDVSFDLDLNGDAGGDAGNDGKLTLSELISSDLDLEKVFQYDLQGAAAMSFGVTTSLSGSAAIPSFSFDLSSLLPLFDYSNKQETAAPANASSFYFDNIKLNFGSYITQMLSPIVDGLDSILGPLYPIVDALYSDTQIFAAIGIESTFDTDKDGHVTAIDLASWFADFYATIDKDRGKQLQSTIESTIEFLDTIKGVMDLIHDLKVLSEEGDFYIDYGSYELPTFSAADESVSTEEDVDLDEDGATADLTDDTETQADEGGSSGSGKSSSKFKEIMKQLDELGFEIPLIDEPKNAIKLLLGKDDVDLFTWTMPEMGMSSEIERSFPIYPGIEGIIEGGFGVDANLGFGFDSYGLNQWKQDGFKANDAWKVFDGFYVADWKDGKDIPEFSMEASMGAGLGLSALVVKSEITGGLEAAASFDLLDQGEIAGTADGRIRGTEISSLISHPLDLFELVGNLSAYLKAKVQVGVDAGLFQTWDTVWQETLAEIPLFEFGVGGSYGTGSVSNGYVKGATVFWDGNQNLRLDSYEPSTITGADAGYSLRIDHRSFDRNRNGTIDASEGNLVAFGGIDSSTGLALEVPFLAPLGQMVTPLTTLHTLAVATGYGEGAASTWIDQAFSLKGFDYLKRDPVLELNQLAAGASPAQLDPLAAYIGHIKLHFSWDVLVYSLQQLLSKQFPEEIKTEFGLINAFSQELLGLAANISINERLATAALRTISRFKPDLPAVDGPLASLAAGLAANASWDLSQQIDALFVSASEETTSLADSLVAINQLKRDAFVHYRTDTESISRGLYRISEPEELARAVQQRLSAVYSSFIKNHPLQSATEDQSNGLIKLLDTKDWALSGATTLTSTPFTTIQSLEQLGISLGDRQLDFELRLQPSSDELSAVNQLENPRVLVGLNSLGLPQRTADAAFNYYVDIDQTPTPFLYDANSRTGARLFNLGSGLAPVLELSYRDDRRGDGNPDPGVIEDSGAVAELVQAQQFKVTDQANVFSVGASIDADTRSAAVFLSTDVVSLASTSNQVGYLLLQDNEIWDPTSLTLGQLLERIQYIAGSLENSDLPTLGSAMKFQRELQFSTSDRFVFLEVVDRTLADLGPSSASVASQGERILTLESRLMSPKDGLLLESPKSGLKLQLKLQNAEPGLPAFLARQQSQAPVLDFTGLGGMSVAGSLQMSREAGYNATVGFYQVRDVSGAVTDPLTGTILHPADDGYQQAALHRSNLLAPLSDLSTENHGGFSRELSISADGFFAPYVVVDTGNGSHTYFAFAEANADLLQHVQMAGDNTFVLEDLFGGGDRDFDDSIVSFHPIGVMPLAPA